MLDATDSISYELPVQTTNYAVEDGSDISDNIALRPRTVSFTGIITDVKSAQEKANLSTFEYISGLEAIRDKRELFKIYFSSDLPPLENVFFQSLRISQDNTNGTLRTPDGDRFGLSSFKISFTVKEIRITNKIELGKIRADELNIAKESEATAATNFDDKNDKDLTESQQTARQILSLTTGKTANQLVGL